jgi:transposase
MIYQNALNEGKVALIMDNASVHKAKKVKEFLNKEKINVLFSCPYFPEFNLAEQVFCLIKRKYYGKIFNTR